MLRSPGTGAMRIVRGLVCAGVCLLLGCVAHGWAEGHLPGPISMMVAFAALAVVCVGLANRQRGFGFIAVVLGGAQLFLHFGFAVAAASAAAPGLGGHVSGHGGGHLAAPPVVQDNFSAWTGDMAVGHVLATLASAACLAYGERVVWWLARLVMPRLSGALAQPVPISGPPKQPVDALVLLPVRHGALLARCLERRGPPLWSFA
jgi:hypothetical protein